MLYGISGDQSYNNSFLVVYQGKKNVNDMFAVFYLGHCTMTSLTVYLHRELVGLM